MAKLPWIVSACACSYLALSGSGQVSQYQASIDGDYYMQTGDLRVLWINPNEANGLLMGLAGFLGAVGSVWQFCQTEQAFSESKKSSKSKNKPTPDSDAETEEDEELIDAPDDEQDAEIDIDDEVDEPQESVKPEQPQLFDRVWNHRKRHLLIPAETGAGKTTLLLGLLKYFWAESSQTVEIYGSTVKRSPWLGIEFEMAPDKLPKIINLDVTQPATIEALICRLRWLQSRLQKRQKQRADAEAANQVYAPNRIVIVADEWNSTLALAARFDKILAREFSIAKAEKTEPLPQPPYAVDELKSLMESILLMGREDECAEWVFGQDHQVQNAGFNTGYRKSFGVLVPFRKGATQSLEDALIGRSPVLPMAIGKQVLDRANAVIEAKPDGSFIYSNLNGHEILEMPYMPNIKREKLNGKQQSATGQSKPAAESATELSESDPW